MEHTVLILMRGATPLSPLGEIPMHGEGHGSNGRTLLRALRDEPMIALDD
jgi:hypothetical protein